MGEAKFTPGPWVLREHDERYVVKVIAPNFRPNCELHSVAHVLVDGEDIELLANAALIAAAPDLYEALSALTEACETDCCGEGDEIWGDEESVSDYAQGEGGSALTFGMIRRARAALAKACPTPTVAATDNEGGEQR